jgi:hypothetical protein
MSFIFRVPTPGTTDAALLRSATEIDVAWAQNWAQPLRQKPEGPHYPCAVSVDCSFGGSYD